MDQKLTDLTISQFIDLLGSDAPAPGGGSASALAGTIGASLCSMVADLTKGKEKYAQHETLMQDISAKAHDLSREFLSAIDRDTEAFHRVTDVFRMPKSTDEEKAIRAAALQDALCFATKVPFSMMELSLQALQLTSSAVGKSNTNAASDLGVAALNLRSSAEGAWLNVLINLGGIKDKGFVDDYKSKGESILNECTDIADSIVSVIKASL